MTDIASPLFHPSPQLLTLLHHTVADTALIDPFAADKNPCSIIRNAEFICLGCDTLARCEKEDDVWKSRVIGTCDTEKGMVCDAPTRSCIYLKECVEAVAEFECQNKGIYPDPFFCKFYHICNANNQDERRSCTNGYVYSISERACVLPLNSAKCKEPQYTCDQPSNMGAWPDDKNIYYVCFADSNGALYPRLYRCSNPEHIFDDYLKSCVPAVPCTNGELIADKSDLQCQSYFFCRNHKLVRNYCPSGYVFNPTRLACVFGSC